MENNLYPVKTKNELIALVHSLSKESEGENNSWENNTLPSFLSAIASWIEDMDGFYENTGKPIPDDINWSFLADILMAARVYE